MSETEFEHQSVEEYRGSVKRRIHSILKELERVDRMKIPHSQPYKLPNNRILPWNRARQTYIKEVEELNRELKWLKGEIRMLQDRLRREKNATARSDALAEDAAFTARTRENLDEGADTQMRGGEGMTDTQWDAIGGEAQENLDRWMDTWADNPSRANFKSTMEAAANLLGLQNSNDSNDSFAQDRLDKMREKLRRILKRAVDIFKKNPTKANARRVFNRTIELGSLGGDVDPIIDSFKDAAKHLVRPRARPSK